MAANYTVVMVSRATHSWVPLAPELAGLPAPGHLEGESFVVQLEDRGHPRPPLGRVRGIRGPVGPQGGLELLPPGHPLILLR